MTIYDIKVKNRFDEDISLEAFKDKVLLIVNILLQVVDLHLNIRG